MTRKARPTPTTGPRPTHTPLPVTAAALYQRINRTLTGKVLRRARGKQAGTFGTYYILDPLKGVELPNVDIEALGRELGVLKPFESLVKDGGR